MRIGLLILLILAVIFVAGFLLGRGFLASASGREIRYIAQQDTRIIRGYPVVHDSTYVFDMHQPYYPVTVAFPLLKGDIIEVEADGKGLWDHGMKDSKYVFASPSGAGNDVKFIEDPKRPSDVKLKNAPVASLIGVIGDEVRWDKNAVAYVERGTDHFFIGDARIFETPRNGRLFFAMNERWTNPSDWDRDNVGAWMIHVKVRRR